MDIVAFIEAGESQTVEFIQRAHSPNVLSKLISAFSNTEGGAIFVGVKEQGEPVGINTHKFEKIYSQAISQLDGMSTTTLEIVEYRGKEIGVVKVGKSEEVVGSKDGYFQRVGETVRAYSADQLKELFISREESSKSITQLSGTVATQTEEISKLRQSFDKVNSWKMKLFYALLGALATAVVKLLFVAIGL